MFHVHFEVARCDEGGFVENGQQLASGQTMVGIILKPGLEAANGFGSLRTAAVYKFFIDLRDLGDVRVRGDFGAGRQNEPDVSIGMFRQRLF